MPFGCTRLWGGAQTSPSMKPGNAERSARNRRMSASEARTRPPVMPIVQRTLASVFPRQSPGSLIFPSINTEADSIGAGFLIYGSNSRNRGARLAKMAGHAVSESVVR